MTILGVDIGKSEFHCALLSEDERLHRNSFPNSFAGFERLSTWLKNRKVERVHACVEASGGFNDELAYYLVEAKHVVSVVNASSIKAFGESRLSRTKTDRADAELIARFCRAMQPEAWRPPTPSQRRLQQLVRRRVSLVEMLTQEENRLEAPGGENVRDSIERTIKFLKLQIKQIEDEIDSHTKGDPALRDQRALLESIPGIGPRVSTTLLGEIPNLSEFKSRKAVAAYAGLCPRERRSGTSVSTSCLSRLGNRAIRRVLYMPAIVSERHNPAFGRWAAQLRLHGKRGKKVIAALMRRLLVLAYGVLKSGKPFDPSRLDAAYGI